VRIVAVRILIMSSGSWGAPPCPLSHSQGLKLGPLGQERVRYPVMAPEGDHSDPLVGPAFVNDNFNDYRGIAVPLNDFFLAKSAVGGSLTAGTWAP